MERWEAEDSGIRTKGGDSATFHIHALLANGQFQEAEALLAQAVAAGLVAQETATRLQEQISERKGQQNPGPNRLPPLGHLEDPGIEDSARQRRTCWTELPSHPVCHDLPEEYSFHSARQALEAMKLRLNVQALALHKPERALEGPCPGVGQHYNVRIQGKRAGSITCCPCCVEAADGPLEWTKCRIVW
jgi:hypothetical protein